MTESFEAKKHAWRQVQDGIVLSLVIHPNDLPKDMAVAPLGTRYMVAVAEIGDDGKPVEKAPPPSQPVPAKKDRRPFDRLPLSQQAAIRCHDVQFRNFLANQCGQDTFTKAQAAEDVRARCDVDSRSKIMEGDKSGDHWLNLEAYYQQWLTDQRYGEQRHG